ncbi:MAG: hypothetical protein ACLTCB_06810, partial [Merdibacter sp.]
NEAWIDQYLHEAELHGAAAIITYDTGGYATYSDEMINMQDVCAEDVMPCVSISASQYRQLAEAIEAGNDMATLIVDNVLQEEQGTSYNVVGRLKGRSDEQQIIVSGHYDVYFNGFQDDSCAIGLVWPWQGHGRFRLSARERHLVHRPRRGGVGRIRHTVRLDDWRLGDDQHRASGMGRQDDRHDQF